MKVRAQIGMVLNLDKCIGCHTCSVTCKNVWTSRDGVEYAWFNNVETKPGIGYPKDWENQKRWNGGWERTASGGLRPKQGGKWRILANIFANPDLPEIDDFYEPFDFDYDHLKSAPEMEAFPTARPRSKISGERMEKIEWGPNWEEILGGEFSKRSKDYNFEGIQKEIYGQYENTFMMYLPRLCEHCLNPACAASCPSGAIYKREEDGVVLIDQEKCRGWRMCVSGCPYKKIYYNWSTGKSEKCTLCYPRLESGLPTVCSETCVGRIRYIGVMLYDADKIAEAASVEGEKDLYDAQLGVFLDPNDPEGDRGRARRGRAGGLDRVCPKVADLEDGDGVEDRLPAASRIPNAADGLVHPAALADPERRRRRPDRGAGRHAGREIAPHPGALPRQHADGGRRGAGDLGAGTDARHALLHALEDGGRRGQPRRRQTRRPDARTRSTRCTRSWPSPITRTASSSRRRTAKWSRTPMTCAAAAASPTATAARPEPRAASFSAAASSSPRRRAGNEDVQGTFGAALLSDR